MITIKDYDWYMGIALEEAEHAYKKNEVPVGCVIIDKDGLEITRTHNLKEATHNPLGHAELLAISEACKSKKNWRLSDCTMIVSLEPCLMCMAALIQARIGRLVFGAYDPKGGSISLGQTLFKDERLNHSFSVVGGIRHFETSRILSQFFKERRKQYQVG